MVPDVTQKPERVATAHQEQISGRQLVRGVTAQVRPSLDVDVNVQVPQFTGKPLLSAVFPFGP